MPRRVFAVAAAAALVGLTGSVLADPLDLAPAVTLAMQTAQPPKVVPPVARQTAAERCASLEQQFAAAALLHFASKKLASARKLAEEGTEDCDKKKYSLGTRRLVEALEELGVTAKL